MKVNTNTKPHAPSSPRRWPGQAVLCVLAAAAAILVWEAFLDSPDEAAAQSDRKQSLATSEALSSTTLLQDVIKAQNETTAKLDELTKLFLSGKAKVEIVAVDEPKPAPVAPPVRPGVIQPAR